jgi:hypothetical protein
MEDSIILWPCRTGSGNKYADVLAAKFRAVGALAS